MRNEGRFEEPVSVTLKRDEAIVLLWYLTRELWNEHERNLRASFVHPAEAHSLKARLQELILPPWIPVHPMLPESRSRLEITSCGGSSNRTGMLNNRAGTSVTR